ncbi:MAG: 50S ribosomal protein L19 [Patescibacteria group bacterium]
MAINTKVKEFEFSVGDNVRVTQKIDKHESNFDGIVIKIKGRGIGKTFTVRRMGEAGIGIEKIFPVELPSIEKVTVLRRGVEGVRRSKLYYIRKQSPTEIEMIFKKASIRHAPKVQGKAKKKSGKIKK